MTMKKYNPKSIEAKWQKYWQTKKTFVAKDVSPKKKKFILVEFPYPSGAGLHMGHMRGYTAGDVTSRYWRLKGQEVLFPIGWDAFGLPAENYAIKTGVHPKKSTAKNVSNFIKQINSLGYSFDWSREVDTTDPDYYKWTQWLFLQFFKAGLAYEATAPINWCPKDKTGLANEEVINGACERCGTPVEKREMRQWYLKITAYAEKLLKGLQELPEWPDMVKTQQENWIGKSEGVSWNLQIKDLGDSITAFDSVPQTFKAQTFAVIAPEHPLVKKMVAGTKYEKDVLSFVERIQQKKLEDKFDFEKNVEGIFTGRYVKDPFGTGDLPIWVASFVVMDYGSGFVTCSAHDERDFAFAKKYNIPLRPVMFPVDPVEAEKVRNLEYCYHHAPDGIMEIAPEVAVGLRWEDARAPIIAYIEKEGLGKRTVQYKLRDWLFSRQRYWGEPIPVVHCQGCGVVAVPEKDLPVTLPPVKKYEPTGTGESPLAAISSWVNTKCPQCKGPAKRETNTMPQWAGSSWYWLRYADPKNKKEFASKAKLKRWTPVDIYFGGMEHTTLHLLYSRFWNLFLYDKKLVTTKEPYKKRVPHGIILAADGEKMSKSRGNVVNPDDIVKAHGADTARMYELFLGPHEAQVAWNDKGAIGVRRFLDRVWSWGQSQGEKVQGVGGGKNTEKVERAINKLIKKVGEDIEAQRFNTCISALMEFLNEVKDEPASNETYIKFLTILYPFAPHIAEELYEQAGGKKSLQQVAWPKFDPKKVVETTVEFVIQINGKLKDKLQLPLNTAESEAVALAKTLEKVQAALGGASIRKTIFVPNRLVNFVI